MTRGLSVDPLCRFQSGGVSQSVDLGRSNNPNTTPTKDYENVRVVVYLCSLQFREDMLRRGRGDLHQQGGADDDAGYS